MSIRRWTVVVVPQGAGTSRELQVSSRAVRALLVGGVLFALATLAGSYLVVTKTVDLRRLGRMERRNATLEQEIDRMQVALAEVSDTIAVITSRDREVRLLAGLEPQDPEVQQAGVGGPAGPPSPDDLLLGETTTGRTAITMRDELGNLNRRAELLLASFDQAVNRMDSTTERLARTPSIMPTAGFISSGFSHARMHPVYHTPLPHLGIDIPAPRGTPIQAVAKGRVVKVEVQSGYGNILTLDHGNGIRTRYAHCSEILVKVGDRVARGDDIALVGMSGVATNYHLHYEVMVHGRQVDPRGFLFGGAIVD